MVEPFNRCLIVVDTRPGVGGADLGHPAWSGRYLCGGEGKCQIGNRGVPVVATEGDTETLGLAGAGICGADGLRGRADADAFLVPQAEDRRGGFDPPHGQPWRIEPERRSTRAMATFVADDDFDPRRRPAQRPFIVPYRVDLVGVWRAEDVDEIRHRFTLRRGKCQLPQPVQ